MWWLPLVLILIPVYFINRAYRLQFEYIDEHTRKCRKCGSIHKMIPREEDRYLLKWEEVCIEWEDGTKDRADDHCSCHQYEINV